MHHQIGQIWKPRVWNCYIGQIFYILFVIICDMFRVFREIWVMCAYMHSRMYASISVGLHACMLHACMHAYIRTFSLTAESNLCITCTCVCVYIYVCMCIYIVVCIQDILYGFWARKTMIHNILACVQNILSINEEHEDNLQMLCLCQGLLTHKVTGSNLSHSR